METIAQRHGRDAARTSFLRLVLLLLAMALANVPAYAENTRDNASSTPAALQKLLPARDKSDASKPTPLQAQLQTIYDARDFEPVWTGSDDAAARAAAVRATLAQADQQGLRSSDYLSGLSRWKKNGPKGGHDAAEYDLALTTALLRYASDVRVGSVDPKDVYRDVSLPLRDFDPAAELSGALKHDRLNDFLASLPPVHPGYRYLVEALARYRAISTAGGWPTVPGKSGFAVDGKDRRVAVLSKRLAFEDPVLAANPDPSADDLRDAVMRFQMRNGLKPDGKVGPDMLKALNVPAIARVHQIIANMERWRWMPRLLERHYVEVDVPDQSLQYVDADGSVLLRSPVVIGRKTTPTPILRTEVQTVVANPPWDIPSDIFARKILPQLRRHHDYLVARNMVLAGGPADDPHGIQIDWRKVNVSDPAYQFQQNPGPDNVLGTLLLDMPNVFGVYLHDTPDKKLFQLDDRERSNGCVRVQEISKLASLALTGSPTDGADDLDTAIASGQTQRIKLDKPLTVYMVYWTAVAGPNGAIDFRPDLYGRDPPLIARLQDAHAARS